MEIKKNKTTFLDIYYLKTCMNQIYFVNISCKKSINPAKDRY